jgi:hypothetical protein
MQQWHGVDRSSAKGIKQIGHEADSSPPSSGKVKGGGAIHVIKLQAQMINLTEVGQKRHVRETMNHHIP